MDDSAVVSAFTFTGEAEVFVRIFSTWINKPHPLGQFLVRRIVRLAVVADVATIIEIGPSEFEIGVPRFREEVINLHSFFAPQFVIRREAIRAAMAKQNSNVGHVVPRSRKRTGILAPSDSHC